jgi:hypothetical protein
MDDTELQPSRPYRMPLSEVAKVQLYEPVNCRLANPVLKEQSQIEGDFVANMASYAICSEFDFGDSWQHDHWD